MFVDLARIYVKGGDGGNGSAVLRREKYIPEGGPWGGDGGRGGSVILVVDEGLRTLLDFRYQRHFKAPRGGHGAKNNRTGADGEDIYLKVPPGTLVRDEATDAVLADLTEAGQTAVVARGGRGGRGNTRFATSVNRTPTFAEKGEPGEERWIVLELKLLADAGLVGYPNAGKSTLLSRVSGARPKVASYPFTTLTPHLGVVEVGERSFVLADIPGLIEGAAGGAGLGHEFLRHVERTRVLVHVLDGAGTEGRDPLQDFDVINGELAAYSPLLPQKPQLVAVNKMDLPAAQANWPRLKAELEGRGYTAFAISAASGQGVEKLLYAVLCAIDDYVEPDAGPEPQRVWKAEDPRRFVIRRDGRYFHVEGKYLERLVAMTDWTSDEAANRFLRIIRRMGLEAALRKQGAGEGSIVRIRDMDFPFESLQAIEV